MSRARTRVTLYSFRLAIPMDRRTEDGPETWHFCRYFATDADAIRHGAQAQAIHGVRSVAVLRGGRDYIGWWNADGRWVQYEATPMAVVS